MRDRLTAVIAILLLGTLIGMSYWYSVRAKQELIVHLSDLSSPDFISQDSVVTRFDANGDAKDKLFATNVKHYSDGHATGEQPHYYSINTKSPQITARSDYVDMVSGGEVFHFKDNVVLTQAASEKNPASRLETSALDAYPDTDEYKSDKPVKMWRGKDTSEGLGMDYDNVERTFKLRSRVQTTIQPATVRKMNKTTPAEDSSETNASPKG